MYGLVSTHHLQYANRLLLKAVRCLMLAVLHQCSHKVVPLTNYLYHHHLIGLLEDSVNDLAH